MIEIILSIFIVIVGWFWSSSMKAREIALHVVRHRCRQMELQLLDDYVALTGLWPRRNAGGKIQAWRSYVFEFSVSGTDRYRGKIVLLGGQVESIYLEPHRDPDQYQS